MILLYQTFTTGEDMKITINWRVIRVIMAEKQIDSFAELTRVSGVHKNTMGHEGSFTSNTLGRLAKALGVHPCELISVEE